MYISSKGHRWPTEAHESFTWIMQPLIEATAKLEHVRCELNTPVKFLDGPYRGDSLTADLSFGTMTPTGPKYSIIVESAFSQSFDDAEIVVKKHLTRADVAGVVLLKFHCPQFHSPTAASSASPVELSQFRTDATICPLGPIKYGGHVWATDVSKITVKVFARKMNNVTPGAKDLNDSQDEVIELLHDLTLRVLGEEVFKSIFPTDASFAINWKQFYADLQERSITD
ncbi:hypothetical protein C8J57DRAFT_1249955 [Mycena rebaudengoi]|nr:hypothetical protein C8J57DRAFT_1249955 [Mycena rebaudengoi]